MINTIQKQNKTINIKPYKRTQTNKKHFPIFKTLLKLIFLSIILYNLYMTIQIYNKIPHFTDKENELIMHLEEIPQIELLED